MGSFSTLVGSPELVRHTTTDACRYVIRLSTHRDAGCVPSQYHGCLKPPHYYAYTASGPSEVGLLSSFRLMLSSQAPGPSEGLFEPLLHVSLSGLRACGGTQALAPSVLWLMLSGALMTVTVHRTVPSHDPRSSDLRAYDTPYHKRKEDLGRHTAKEVGPTVAYALSGSTSLYG